MAKKRKQHNSAFAEAVSIYTASVTKNGPIRLAILALSLENLNIEPEDENIALLIDSPEQINEIIQGLITARDEIWPSNRN